MIQSFFTQGQPVLGFDYTYEMSSQHHPGWVGLNNGTAA